MPRSTRKRWDEAAGGGIDIERMGLRELIALSAQIEELLPHREREERRALKHQMHALACAAGYSLDDVLGGSKRGAGRQARALNGTSH